MKANDPDKWITNVKCPFCRTTVLSEYNTSDVPDGLEAEELEEIDKSYQVGVYDGGCDHVAMYCSWGYFGPTVEKRWYSQMKLLVEALEPGQHDSGKYDINVDKSGDILGKALYQAVDDSKCQIREFPRINGEILPGFQVAVFSESFDSHDYCHYRYIFIKQSKTEPKMIGKKTSRLKPNPCRDSKKR